MFKLDIFFGMFFLKSLLLLFRLKGMLLTLFAFEFLMMKLMLGFVYLSMPFDSTPLLVFLAVAAGEASLGLSLLVSMVRSSGKDKVLGLPMSKYEGFSRSIHEKIGFGPFGEFNSAPSCKVPQMSKMPLLFVMLVMIFFFGLWMLKGFFGKKTLSKKEVQSPKSFMSSCWPLN